MNEKEMKAFDFVDYNKIKKDAKNLSLYGIYGLANDIMIHDEKDILGLSDFLD